MDFETFSSIVEQLKNISDRTSRAYKADVDLINYNNDFHTVIDTLLNEVFTKESMDWFDWYVFEKDFGRDKNMEAWDENKNPICRDVKELYELMKYKKHD